MSKYISEDVLLEDLWESKCESDILRRVRQAIVDEIIGIEGIEIVHCSECKLNSKNPRQYSDPDPVEFYLWCEMFADADGYCPFGK